MVMLFFLNKWPHLLNGSSKCYFLLHCSVEQLLKYHFLVQLVHCCMQGRIIQTVTYFDMISKCEPNQICPIVLIEEWLATNSLERGRNDVIYSVRENTRRV